MALVALSSTKQFAIVASHPDQADSDQHQKSGEKPIDDSLQPLLIANSHVPRARAMPRRDRAS